MNSRREHEMTAMMQQYPQLHIDISPIWLGAPDGEMERWAREMFARGLGARIMFGTDQMLWLETIGMAIDTIESADFLSDEQKRDILYNNAARFLRLSEEEIARHHGT